MILCSCSSPRSTSRVSETLICFSGAALAFALHPLAEQSPFQGQLRFPRTEHIDNNVLAKDLGLKFRTSASENPAIQADSIILARACFGTGNFRGNFRLT